MRVRVVIHPAEEGGFWAEVPALPGCITEGDTREEAIKNIREAIRLYLRAVTREHILLKKVKASKGMEALEVAV